jgi:hypothetical protein
MLITLAALELSCGNKAKSLPKGQPTPITFFTSQMTDSRFYVADHFLASIEMQISGEPFAQLLGRNLAGYDRFNTMTDLYIDPATGHSITDPLSYSMAIESYEYSKQPMNNTSFESGAGMSLQFGPLLNPGNVTGEPAFKLLRDRLQQFAADSNTGATAGNWVVSPPPTINPYNFYGWPGFWPVFAEFKSFATDIIPSGGATRGCSFQGGYAAAAAGVQAVGDYECGYNSLNLYPREAKVEKILEAAALGFALWKQGLWTINYWQTLHDTDPATPNGNGITYVSDDAIKSVGIPGNQVVGQYPDPTDPTGKRMLNGAKGVYFGDIPLEGFQGLTMLEEMHNKSALTLGQLLTSDGAQLGGFASTKEAINYDYTSPLKWWPAEIAVTETKGDDPPAGIAWRSFPQPTAFTIKTPASRLRALAALAGGFGEFFALTDFNNPAVGGQPASRAAFDGNPFPEDNQLPDGEDTPHDRALANIKVAMIDIDRLHFDAAHQVLTDEATVSGGAVARGTTVTTVDAAYAIVGMRTALRAIAGTLALYSNDTPDTVGVPTAIDGAALNGSSASLPARTLQLIRTQADFIVAKLVAADGSVANSFDLSSGKADAAPTRLESEASAIRGLLDAYLATSDSKYKQAAMRVYADLDRRFWMSDVRAFRTTAGVSDTLTWSPIVFGTIQGALRQYWKLVGNRPGNERLAAEILERVQRTNKLVANGWDDANGDNKIQYPNECTGAGLQMAERALTGELSHVADNGDRDRDCVPEIAGAMRPAALAGQVVFKRRPQ